MVSEKIFFLKKSIISLWKLLVPGWGQFGLPGLDWQDFYRGPLDIVTYQISKLWAS